jgi:hypothetical protein
LASEKGVLDMRVCLVLISVIVSLVSASALAQNEDTSRLPPAAQCDGDYAIVRVSQIAPGSSTEEFLKVVETHKAWYRSHGFMNNEIYATKILVQDATTKAWKYSDTEIMTFHVRPPREIKVDSEWEAFVKRYKNISDIKSEYIICLPRHN